MTTVKMKGGKQTKEPGKTAARAGVRSAKSRARDPEKFVARTKVEKRETRQGQGRVKESEKFAAGMGFKKLFFIFLIGSVFGTIYEDLLILGKTWIDTGVPVFMLHRGVIYGPFNVIYGFGAVVMIWVLGRKKMESWKIFLYGALLGGVVEYMIGFLQEVFTHTTSWDYSDQFLNINGRTTIPFMMIWGLLGLLLVKVVYPAVSNLIEKIPVRIGEALFVGLVVFMALDMLVSWSAIIRQTLRHNEVPPFTPVGRFLDDCYPDEYLIKYFPNMVRKD